MRVLTIHRNKLEMSRAQLTQPLMTVGRSPTCDFILRAPGIAPFHFLIEWIGEGAFDPDRGAWSITDLSSQSAGQSAGQSADQSAGSSKDHSEHGEGVILSEEAVRMGDLLFTVIEDRLENHRKIGGTIADNLQGNSSGGVELLELVQVRIDSGAIEEIRHFPVIRKARLIKPIRQFREFRLQWQPVKQTPLLKILLEEMPGAEVFNRGHRLPAASGTTLSPQDVLQVRWKGRDFYLRFVPEVRSPAIPRQVMDPLLKRVTAGVILSTAILMALVRWGAQSTPPEEPVPGLRIATVEIPPPPEQPKAVEPPPPMQEEVAKSEKPVEPDPQSKSAKEKISVSSKKIPQPAKAAAPRYDSDSSSRPKSGLNSPAKTAEVNSVGILGALNKLGSKGKGVQADKIMGEAIVTDSVSSQHGESKIVVRNPPSGVLGKGSGGSPNADNSQDLSAASTTLSGAGKYDPSAVGPIARKGAASGANLGSDLSSGKGGASGTEFGSLDSGDFSVEGGGLERETVRRVIATYRGQIRTCYERALLSNPKMAGRIVYHWKISAEGPVVSTAIKNATLESDSMKACVIAVIKQMVFPRAANGRATQVIYPFVFQGRK